jgi:hypothetical protein
MNINLCWLHLHGAKRDLVDIAREQRLLREAQSDNKIKRSEAVRSLAAIARRRMHRSWKIDARLPGATVPVLQERDAERVERWLLERGFRQGHILPATGRLPSPRFWDRVFWAAVLALGSRLSETASRLRLELALKDEVAFWKRGSERWRRGVTAPFATLLADAEFSRDGRRLRFQIRPSRKQHLREALKRETARRRAAALQARLIEKGEAGGVSTARRVDPLDRAALVKRLRKPEMTDDEVDELLRIVDAYLSGRLSAPDWRLWLRGREAERAAEPPPPRCCSRPRTISSDSSGW